MKRVTGTTTQVPDAASRLISRRSYGGKPRSWEWGLLSVEQTGSLQWHATTCVVTWAGLTTTSETYHRLSIDVGGEGNED